MGANPYCYFAPYQQDIARALAALQQQEFDAGRYDPALQAANPPTYTFMQKFPPGANFPSPGAQHGSIDEAREAGAESGTGSILDVAALSVSPELLCASPTTHESLVALFATSTPNHAQVASLGDLQGAPREQIQKIELFWDEIGRGQARYFLVYADGAPAEIFFAGMSID
ncbi:MAG: hypothetical protein QM759_15275 [Terricaulis sp.]